MHDRVTVIPEDSVIIINGYALFVSFSAPDDVRAIQWHIDSGHVEYSDGRDNTPIYAVDYQTMVAPFVSIWETEKIRLDEEDKIWLEKQRVQNSRDEILSQLTAIDMSSIRSLRAVAAGTQTKDDNNKLEKLDNEAKQLRQRLSLL